MSETFETFELAQTAFNQKLALSRTLINDKWEIKSSKSSSKRNKTDLKRIKEYIANLKKDAENAAYLETNLAEYNNMVATDKEKAEKKGEVEKKKDDEEAEIKGDDVENEIPSTGTQAPSMEV